MNAALLRFVREWVPGPVRSVARSLYYPLYRIFVWAWCTSTGARERFLGGQAATPPLPPPHLRFRVAGSPSRDLFLKVGKRSSEEIEASLEQAGRPLASFRSILDFGCGCGRTLTWLVEKHPATAFHGTMWMGRAFSGAKKNYFWLFRVLSGRRSQIEFPTGEVDGVDEVLLIAETARRGLDPLNP